MNYDHCAGRQSAYHLQFLCRKLEDNPPIHFVLLCRKAAHIIITYNQEAHLSVRVVVQDYAERMPTKYLEPLGRMWVRCHFDRYTINYLKQR